MEDTRRILGCFIVIAICTTLSACGDQCGSYLGAQRMEDGTTVICEACEFYRTAKVVRVAPDGTEVWSYRYPDSDLDFPHSAYWNPDDTLTIADSHHGRIIIVDTETKETVWDSRDVTLSDPTITGLYYNNYACSLPNGNVLVSLRDGHMLVELQLDGTVDWTFGEFAVPGNDDSHLNGPHWPQRLPNGNTMIPDSWNHRVIEVTPGGEIVWSYEPEELPYYLGWPRCAQVLSNGNVLITDAHDHWEVTRAGEVVKHFVRPGGTTDWGYTAHRLENDNYLLCGYHRIDEMTPDGEIVWSHVTPTGLPPAPRLVQ